MSNSANDLKYSGSMGGGSTLPRIGILMIVDRPIRIRLEIDASGVPTVQVATNPRILAVSPLFSCSVLQFSAFFLREERIILKLKT